MSTTELVRKDMRDWVLSEEGDKWSVKLDIRDLGGHLHTTFRRLLSTLAARVRLVIVKILMVVVLPLNFHCRLEVVPTIICAVLHGVEASLLVQSSLLKLRAAVLTAVLSRRQPLAHAGAVLSLLAGSEGCHPGFCVVWFRFRMLRRYLAYRSQEVRRIYRMLDLADEGCPGHGPYHLLVASAANIGFVWTHMGGGALGRLV